MKEMHNEEKYCHRDTETQSHSKDLNLILISSVSRCLCGNYYDCN
jgi:hypothetical protein